MIVFEKIKIQNFMAIGEAEVNLNLGGFTLISGINNRAEDQAQSNGAAKTSISEALVWALTGETIRGSKEVLNRYTDGDCLVELTLSFKSSVWLVRRGMSRTKEKTLEIVKDGLILPYKGYKDAQAVLERELPELTFKFLNSVVILGQGLPGRFTNNSPAGRKAVLEELTNADYMINQVKESIARRGETLAKNLRKVEDQLLVDQSNMTFIEKTIEIDNDKLSKLKEFNLEKAKENLNGLLKQGKNQAGVTKNLKSQWENLKSLRDKTSEESHNFSLDAMREEGQIEADKTEAFYQINLNFQEREKEETKALLEEETDLNRRLEMVQEDLEHSRAIVSGGVCKYCGQRLPSISGEELEKANGDIKDLSKEELYLQDLFKENREKQAKIHEKYDKEKEIVLKEKDQEYSEKLWTIKNNNEAKKRVLVDELESLTAQENKAQKDYLEANDLLGKMRTDYSSLENQISQHEENLNSLTKEIEEQETMLSEVKTLIETETKEKGDIEARQKIVKQMETFAQRDFRGILLEDIVNRLDQILKGYSEKVYGNRLTRFYQEGNNIGVEFDGKEYESLSGGEQQKINVILQLALRDLIIELTGVSGSFLLLDEVFDGLDYQSCEKMIDLFQSLGTSVFIITHHQELDIPYDYQITMVKEPDGVAHIQY